MPFRWAANKYMCFYCVYTFVDSSKLKEHTIEEHTGARLKNVLRAIKVSSSVKLDITNASCKKCARECTNLEDFMNHFKESHGFSYDDDVLRSFLTFKLADDGMSCLECKEVFQFFSTMLKHVHKTHNKFKTFLCEICGQGFIAKTKVENHIKNVHGFKDLHCYKCDEDFKTSYALQSHYEKRHRTGPVLNRLKCPKCPEVLGSVYLKKRHLAMVHDVKKHQFGCDECDHVFTSKRPLLQHKLSVHLKQKTVTCDICGFKVFNNDLLRRHMVRHNDSRPYACEYCKKTFQRKKTLDCHVRIHTNDKRYACKECGRAFVQVTSYKLHMRVHHTGN